MSVWDSPEFAQQWNDTYGLDMSRAPIRPGIIYPLIAARICWPQNQQAKIRIADFGCGNGNFIRAFNDKPFVEWLGVDNGEAILATARPLAAEGTVCFLNGNIGQTLSGLKKSPGFDHVVSVFTLEEIPLRNLPTFFDNMAAAVSERSGYVHIFTQHPAYALQQDILSLANDVPNEKFQGHRGYFDTEPATYNLSILNGERNCDTKPAYHHKPFAAIINGLANAGLCLQEALEIPAGVTDMNSLKAREPERGDVPRFLYLRARYL